MGKGKKTASQRWERLMDIHLDMTEARTPPLLTVTRLPPPSRGATEAGGKRDYKTGMSRGARDVV